MADKSKTTKRAQILYVVMAIVSVLLWLAPISVYGIMAIINGTLLYQKVSLAVTVFIVAIMTLISLSTKVALRSRLWIFLIGLYVCLQNIMTPIVVFASCQILDELLITPIKNRAKTKYTINKEIDKRIN